MLDKTDDGNKIKIELVKSNTRMRLPATSVVVHRKGRDGGEGPRSPVCECCLEAGDIDERLERRAARLEEAADDAAR